MTEITTRTEIRASDDDSYAPGALIGWIAQADYPAGTWVAIFSDLDDLMHDPQPVKSWSKPLASAEAAEEQVRASYHRWVAKRESFGCGRGRQA